LGGQRWRCADCGRRFTARSASAFSRHDFPDDLIALAVRHSVRYRLSYADVVEWLAERGVTIDRSTVYRWVQRFLPLFGEAARQYRRPVGDRWRADETYTRLNGRWTYLYRAIDQDGQVVDVYSRSDAMRSRRTPFSSMLLRKRGSNLSVSRQIRPSAIRLHSAGSYPTLNIGAHGTSTMVWSGTTGRVPSG
jgi:hypothetical protein